MSHLFDIFPLLWRTCRAPGRPPRKWGWLTLLIVGSCLVTLASLLASTHPFYWARLFREGRVGTFLSVGYLAVDGLVCLLVCHAVLQRSESWPRAALLRFAGALAFVVVGAIVMFWAGSELHDRNRYYFSSQRLGRWFWGAVVTTAALGIHAWRQMHHCRPGRFWLTFGSLLCWMALDDLLMWHERAADNVNRTLLHLPETHPFAAHLNDAFVACYGLVALALGWSNRYQLVRLPWMIFTMSFAGLCFIGTVAADFGDWSEWVEESLKILAGATILTALLTAWLEVRSPRFSAQAASPPSGRTFD